MQLTKTEGFQTENSKRSQKKSHFLTFLDTLQQFALKKEKHWGEGTEKPVIVEPQTAGIVSSVRGGKKTQLFEKAEFCT